MKCSRSITQARAYNVRASNHAVRRVQDRIDNTLSMNQARLLALEMAERGHQPNAGDFDRFGVRPVPWQRYLAAFGYLTRLVRSLTVISPLSL